jgi:hypothetical protein
MGQFSMENPVLPGQFSVEINRARLPTRLRPVKGQYSAPVDTQDFPETGAKLDLMPVVAISLHLALHIV